MGTIVVDPITRIEGHLRVEAVTDASNTITRATCAGTMVRGIEIILKGRDPRDAWAFTQRFCGVCTVSNSVASVRAVEHALNYHVPANAQHIRNLMIATQHVHDHVVHFYHLHALDWVDVLSALSADPAKTAALQQKISAHPNNSTAYFAGIRQKLATFAAGGQLGIFANGYWGHPAYKLPAEANLLAFAHYLEALAWQREIIKVHAIFGGKNPHPSFVVGGVPCAISSGDQTAVNPTTLKQVGRLITQMQTFVDQVYHPDLLLIASHYKDWAKLGQGVGNYLTFGEFPWPDPSPGRASLLTPAYMFVPRGAIIGQDLTKVQPVDLEDVNQVQEFISSSWYKYAGGNAAGLHPYNGETVLDYTGPTAAYSNLDPNKPYSWLKTPRWRGKPMETGPLSRVLMLYATGEATTRGMVNAALAKLGLPVTALFSTLGRTLARGIEASVFAHLQSRIYSDLMANIAHDTSVHNAALWDPASWPATARGVGYQEAPRGALAHWVNIGNKLITNYQAIIPTTWNGGPRDPAGQSGPFETALLGHRLADPARPVEILRTIHSFDPCLGCAVHLVDADGKEMLQVTVAAC